MRLLLLSDRTLADTLEKELECDDVAVELVSDINCATFKFKNNSYDAVLLDLHPSRGPLQRQMLQWRRDGLDAHILALLPRSATAEDRAACLDAGADVCLLQPLNLAELRAHLRALRRRDLHRPSPVRRIHDLEINTAIRSVSRAGQEIHLTPREFDLLHLLAVNPGKVLTRTMILEHLYDDEAKDTYSNVVDVYVRYLRNKIDRGFDRPLILTRWGQGYVFRAEGA